MTTKKNKPELLTTGQILKQAVQADDANRDVRIAELAELRPKLFEEFHAACVSAALDTTLGKRIKSFGKEWGHLSVRAHASFRVCIT